jgi:hypothetical protein
VLQEEAAARALDLCCGRPVFGLEYEARKILVYRAVYYELDVYLRALYRARQTSGKGSLNGERRVLPFCSFGLVGKADEAPGVVLAVYAHPPAGQAGRVGDLKRPLNLAAREGAYPGLQDSPPLRQRCELYDLRGLELDCVVAEAHPLAQVVVARALEIKHLGGPCDHDYPCTVFRCVWSLDDELVVGGELLQKLLRGGG